MRVVCIISVLVLVKVLRRAAAVVSGSLLLY